MCVRCGELWGDAAFSQITMLIYKGLINYVHIITAAIPSMCSVLSAMAFSRLAPTADEADKRFRSTRTSD